MTRLLEQLLSDAVYCVASRIRYAACNVGDINQIIQQTVSYIRSEYLKPKLHGKRKLSNSLKEVYLEELNDAEIIATEKIQQQYFVCRKRRDIALIGVSVLKSDCQQGAGQEANSLYIGNSYGREHLDCPYYFRVFLRYLS